MMGWKILFETLAFKSTTELPGRLECAALPFSWRNLNPPHQAGSFHTTPIFKE